MPESIESLYNSIKVKINETSISPFMFIYIISWIIYNHEIPIYFFDDHMDAYERTYYLDSYIVSKGFKIFTCPLFSTAVIFLFWVLISPIQLAIWGVSRTLVGCIEKFILRYEMIKKEKYIEVENELTVFRISMHKLEEEYKNKLSSLDKAKTEAISRNSHLSAELERKSVEMEKKEKEFSKDIYRKDVVAKCLYHRAEHAENIDKYKKLIDYKGSLIYIQDNAFSELTMIKTKSVLNEGTKINDHNTHAPINSVQVVVTGLSALADVSETIFKATGLRPSAKIEKNGNTFVYSELL